MAVRFTLLGPVEVTADGEPLPGIAPRHRAVLAYLLLNAGRVISMERLIDAVWGIDRPGTARSQIHAAVTALRRALRGAGAAELLETRPGGYVAHAGAEQLDVREFAALVDAGRFRDALRLWNGEALAGVHASFAPGARALLDERRLAAVERLMAAELDAGRHSLVLDELAAQVTAHPLRERLAGQLVLALHRCGRQADALAAARAYRTALAEEQGLDPGPSFLDLERSVLAGAPPAPARSSFLPYDLPDFTGRTAELERLAAGHRLVTIDGMPGVGKTTLAVRVAHRLAERFPDGQLFLDLRAHTPGQQPLPPAAALEILLRQLGLTDIPAGAAARAARWRAELAGRRIVAVLDNAADGEHVRPLLPGVSDSVLLITSRRRLVDLDGAHPLSVEVLPDADAAELFASIVGTRATAEPEAVREVLRLCGHLPLAIRICAARLQHRPRWTVSYLAGRLRLADLATAERSVAAAFTVSYEQLGAAEQRMFRLLGLAPGRDIEAQAAAALAGVAEPEAEDLLESLLDAHMVLQREPGRYTLHDLLREHARSLADPADEDALLRLLVHYLHRSRSAVEVLFPHSLITRPGLPPQLTPVRPVRDAAEATDWLDAERANIIATVTGGPEVCVGHLALALRPYLDRRAHHDDAVVLHSTALRRSRALGDPVVQGRALADLAWTFWRLGDYEQAGRLAEEALATGGDRSLALHTLGNVAWRRRRNTTAERCLSEALDLARVAGDRSAEGAVLGDLGMLLDQTGRHDPARRHLELALALHRKQGDPLGEARVLNQLGTVLRHQGAPGEARDRHRRAGDLYRAMGNRSDEAAAVNGLGEAALALGEPVRAVQEHGTALALADRAGNRPEQARAHDGLSRAYRDQSRPEQAAGHERSALRLYEELGVPEADEVRARLAGTS